MRIKHILLLAFLFATLIPALFFGFWAYNEGVKREFREVEDRHLLLAKNLGNALERYHVDLVAAVEAIGQEMVNGQTVPDLRNLMARLHMNCVLLINRETGAILKRIELVETGNKAIPEGLRARLSEIADSRKVKFSPVLPANDETNVLYAVQDFQDLIVVAQVSTEYFVTLGESISFGLKGHAAIVDHEGNVLAHPLPSWIAARKNIAKVSAVRRMMNGETGIQQFYSPALKGDMIAGLTAVNGPGWGVMIPQPVSELYDKVAENNQPIIAATFLGIVISLSLVWFLLRGLSRPLEDFIGVMRENAKSGRLGKIVISKSALPIRELGEFQESYNSMVDTVGRANQKVEKLAYTDSVTKLPNRARFQQLVVEEVAGAMDNGTSGILIFLDIDNFKEINDMHGHDAGDRVLCSYAQTLAAFAKQTSRKLSGSGETVSEAAVSRIGGDEFTVFLPDISDPDIIDSVLEDLLECISDIGTQIPMAINTSASIGCARYPSDGKNLEELIRHADIAMYQAKKSGKRRAFVYDAKVAATTETEIRTEFSKAIAEGQLVLEYQPKVCTRSLTVTGVEALVRWDHPVHGRLSPMLWIPAIASCALVHELGDWVIRTAMEEQARWKENGLDLSVAVNVSSEQFTNRDLVAQIIGHARATGVHPSQFEIEVTEDALFDNAHVAEQALRRLHRAAFKISIDDFGKGYSNFARLAQMPLDFIKIDQSIVAGASGNSRLNAILDATVNVARELDCEIVAEGIETPEQARFATAKGASLLQGYFFARSMPPEELVRWMAATDLSELPDFADKQLRDAA